VFEDQLLIWRFNAGDTEALRRIYEKYKTDLLGVARALLNDQGAVEDVIHDVFVGFASQAGRFELRGSLKAYLAICVANRARNVLRRRGPMHPERFVDAELRRSHRPDPSMAADMAERRTLVTRALAELSAEQRRVIALHVLGGLRFREIAHQSGESINTVQSRYRYGLQKLRSLLDGQVDT